MCAISIDVKKFLRANVSEYGLFSPIFSLSLTHSTNRSRFNEIRTNDVINYLELTVYSNIFFSFLSCCALWCFCLESFNLSMKSAAAAAVVHTHKKATYAFDASNEYNDEFNILRSVWHAQSIRCDGWRHGRPIGTDRWLSASTNATQTKCNDAIRLPADAEHESIAER